MKTIFKIITFPFVLIYNIIRWIIFVFIPQPRVKLDLSSDPYFVGSYAKIKVETRNISFDELDFNIVEGAAGGYISYCRDAEFDINHPDIMVCFGYQQIGRAHV